MNAASDPPADLVVNVEPLGVVVHLFCSQSHSGHETKRLEKQDSPCQT